MKSAEGSGVGNFFRRACRLIRWPLAILILAYIALVIWRIPVLNAQKQSEETVALIQSKHITLEDVDGKHLPPPPDPAQTDATVAGIDANQNGIRDDVELAIFKKYPNSPYTRAAELQYAMTEQMFLTEVSDKETWKAVAEVDGRANTCLALTYPRTDLQTFLKIIDARSSEVEDLVFNTVDRKNAEDKAYKFTTSFGDAPGEPCDVLLNA
jgi:hypothetical protein